MLRLQEGTISAEGARAVSSIVRNYTHLVETIDLERRITALETSTKETPEKRRSKNSHDDFYPN